MTMYLPDLTEGFLLRVAKGEVPGFALVHKFGHNDAVGTSYVPVTIGGVYQTVQSTSATTLRIAAGDANDTAAGTGAREITLVGLDENFDEQTEVVATAGASASSATTVTFTRFYRAWVSASGTYAGASSGSHAGDIVIENGAGGTTWGTIATDGFPRSQTQIGAYSSGANKDTYVLSYTIQVDSNKAADVIMFSRAGINDTAAPYEAMRMQFLADGVATGLMISPKSPIGPYPEYCDMGFMAKVASGTGHVTVDFELLVVET